MVKLKRDDPEMEALEKTVSFHDVSETKWFRRVESANLGAGAGKSRAFHDVTETKGVSNELGKLGKNLCYCK